MIPLNPIFMSTPTRSNPAAGDAAASPALSDQQIQALAWVLPALEMISEGVVAFDRQGQILYFNAAAEQISGWRAGQAVGASIDRIFKLAESPQAFREVLPGPGGTIRLQVLNPAGEAFNMSVSVPVLEGEMQISPECVTPGCTILVLNGSEKVSVQELRSNFIASITHEFRTPLSALNASVEFLLDEMSHLTKAEIAELLRSVHMSVTGLQTLIDNLLESNSIEAGIFSIHCRTVDIKAVIEEARQVMQPLLLRRRQTVILNLSEPLPVIYADPTRLKQVLVNLLSNASKYGPIDQYIEVIAAPVNCKELKLAVADHGPGIREADRGLLFKRFARIYNQDGPQFGMGLGLSVVKAIVEAHGGRVGVETPPSGGSIFWFTLPIDRGNYASIDR